MAREIIKENHFTIDEFNQPKKSQGKDAIGVLVIRLILLEPGTDQTRPKMGLGIASRYRYIQESDLDKLSDDLKEQIATYLAPFSKVKVTITMKSDYSLVFDIVIDDDVYKYQTEKQNSNSETITLSQLG